MRSIGITLLAAATLALGACDSDRVSSRGGVPSGTATSRAPLSELTPLTDPAAHKGPSTAILTDRSITPVAGKQSAKLPATVTSHDRAGDKQFQVTDASRVITLDIAGSIAATMAGLGVSDLIVGRDVASVFPGMQDVPVVTEGAININAEAVLNLEPRLVLTDGTIGPRDVIEQFRDAGVTVIFVNNKSSFAGAAQLARDVSAVFGLNDLGEKLADKIAADVASTTAAIEKLRGSSPPLRMVFLYLRGSAGIYYLFGDGNGASDLITHLGGFDVATEQGWHEYLPMTDEAMVKANPDLILVMTDGLSSVGGLDKLLASKPAISLTTAGQKKRFVDMADGDILSFGPRSAQVLDALARAIYAPDATS